MTTKTAIAPAELERLYLALGFAIGTLETIQANPTDFNRAGLAEAIRRLKIHEQPADTLAADPDTLRIDLLESTHAFVHVSHPPDAAPVFTIITDKFTAHGTTLRAACDAALKL